MNQLKYILGLIHNAVREKPRIHYVKHVRKTRR